MHEFALKITEEYFACRNNANYFLSSKLQLISPASISSKLQCNLFSLMQTQPFDPNLAADLSNISFISSSVHSLVEFQTLDKFF